MTAYDRIIDALNGLGMKVVGRGPKARAQCPVHHSRGLSLSVRRFNDRATVRCFAGCEDAEVLAEMGLEVRDLFDGPPAPGYTPPKRREPTPWETACRAITTVDKHGKVHHPLQNPPPIEHLLDRVAQAQAEEGDDFPRPFRRSGGVA